MKFKTVRNKRMIHGSESQKFPGAIAGHSEFVKMIGNGMLHELVDTMSDMDIPDNLIITITMEERRDTTINDLPGGIEGFYSDEH